MLSVQEILERKKFFILTASYFENKRLEAKVRALNSYYDEILIDKLLEKDFLEVDVEGQKVREKRFQRIQQAINELIEEDNL